MQLIIMQTHIVNLTSAWLTSEAAPKGLSARSVVRPLDAGISHSEFRRRHGTAFS
jgi:hypothetical protein